MDVLGFKGYAIYLSKRLAHDGKNKRGLKTQLAAYLGCQGAHISQVLSGRSHLTLEQGVMVNEFFGHTEFESEFFLLLLQLDRAGSKKLRDHFQKQIDAKKNEIEESKRRFGQTGEVPLSVQMTYYSAWYYCAVHMLLALPEYADPHKIASRLNLDVAEVLKVIELLLSCGLVSKERNKYVFGDERIYLGRDEVSIKHHHVNWRSQSLQAVERNLTTNLHYSSVVCISKTDFERMKSLFLETIRQTREITGPSKEEEVFAVTVDLFKV